MIRAKVVSSMEKVFLTTDAAQVKPAGPLLGAKGERVSFQILLSYVPAAGEEDQRPEVMINLRSPLFSYVRMAQVCHVPVEMPVWKNRCDDDYVSKEPGLYPDILEPVKNREKIYLKLYAPVSLFVTVDLPQEMDAGEYPLHFRFTEYTVQGQKKSGRSVTVPITVKNVTLPASDLRFTEWFHCDSIASYHGVKMMSKKHWKLIENYIAVAARTGITMLLTPIFTPPLDTAVGTERATMQLVKMEKNGDKYSFDFTDLHRWVEICHKYGIQYFEMAHLFTQWGVEYCPKIIVKVNGKEEKLFGWHVRADSDLYHDFLSQFLPALTKELKAMGIAKNCYFHISDEPNERCVENYRKAKAFVAPLLKGFKMMDALTNVEYYRSGLVDYPVPATNHIEPFLEENIKERWCYYCCGQISEVSNRMIAMPARRTRSLGVSMYMNDISGFLQWGYNFYFSQIAVHKVNPYRSADSMQSYPAGDAFSVYPYGDGAIESLRTVAFYQGLQDRMLLKLLEKKLGKKKTHALVEELAGETITFKQYPRTDAFYTELHDKALALLEEAE